jgi:hypothetical protein
VACAGIRLWFCASPSSHAIGDAANAANTDDRGEQRASP